MGYEKRMHAPHEANFLKLDCSKIKSTLGWRTRWDVATAIQKTVEFSKGYLKGDNVGKIMKMQLEEFFGV